MNTTRKHPRSMAEAFPQESDTGDWEYGFERSHRISDWIISVMAVIVTGLLFFGVM